MCPVPHTGWLLRDSRPTQQQQRMYMCMHVAHSSSSGIQKNKQANKQTKLSAVVAHSACSLRTPLPSEAHRAAAAVGDEKRKHTSDTAVVHRSIAMFRIS
jgi:hypothetical protein